MTRIAVLGDSFIAAWKRGWTQIEGAHPKARLAFCGAPMDWMDHMTVHGDTLSSGHPRLTELLARVADRITTIVATDYDVFVVVGLGFSVDKVVRLYDGWRADSHRYRGGSFAPVSDACFATAVRDLITQSSAAMLAAKLRSIGASKILLAPQPAVSAVVLADTHRGVVEHGVYRGAIESGDDVGLSARFLEASKHFERQGYGVMPQPSSTMDGRILTKSSFHQNPEGFLVHRAIPEYDVTHMGGAYGAACLEELLTTME